MTPIRKTLVVLLALALVAVSSMAAAGTAVAAQGGPSWSTGNQWTYSETGGSVTAVKDTVQEQSTLTIGSSAYTVWHLIEVQTSNFFGSVVNTTIDSWYTSDLHLAKTSGQVPLFGNITAVSDPPAPQLVFPLSPGNTWSGSTSVTTTLGSTSSTQTIGYSGTVTGEQSVTVPAGTFTAEVVRIPAAGSPYKLYYYSEQVGWYVRIASFNGQGNPTTTQDLTSYQYSGNIVLLIVVALVILAVVAIAGYVLIRRRRPPMPYRMPPQTQGPQPYQPPQQGPPPSQP